MLAYITTILWQKKMFFFKPQFPFKVKCKISTILHVVCIYPKPLSKESVHYLFQINKQIKN